VRNRPINPVYVKLPGDVDPPTDKNLMKDLISWLHKIKSVPPKGGTGHVLFHLPGGSKDESF
jgi:hypothetical protein